MDNKPLSAWNSIISLNAAISILTTAYGAALMHGVGNFIGQIKWLRFKEGVNKLEKLERFDEASRGPWGSVMFLATVKLNLATLGALITIARVALSPLTQQVVKIEQQLVPEDDAVFGYAHEYNRGLMLANNVPVYDARANGSTFSFEQTREVVVNSKTLWEPVTDDGLSPHSRAQLNESKVQGIPTLAITRSDLVALQVYLESDSIASKWVSGNWVNKNSGLSAALSGNVDVGKRFEMMALSMTSYLRSGPNSIPAVGTSFSSQPFVSIRWLYLIGPGIIQFAALLFALTTIIGNRKSRNVPLWKSSALAVLACQCDNQSDKIQAEPMDIKEIEKTAETTFAQLE
ncbi:hypothetical protein MAC_02078 [Metarhizium acridum CQMa 102]|uniref:Uncharacterized protein n=1 Tax=Metarhizium acridum (strain CQMa 102) TaxID=655827 RepID=E9DWT0_METAQ|nr:uncharacterized protein MAC_02078 [Metarhizium acridum CQMa 102]EFY91793.1 hypothetical protein MAC_02078 [Metarhizium acridum CQMa 102]